MKRLLLFVLSLIAIGQYALAQTRDSLSLIETIYYERDRYISAEEDRERLEDLVFKMRADSTLKVHIIGYSDKWGGKAVNDRFSYVRAMYIADWMRSCRVLQDQITFVGSGIDSLAKSDAEARRVEVSQVVEVEVKPEPEPEPTPTATPEPEPTSETAPEPEPTPAPEPTLDLESTPTPQPKSTLPITLRSNLLYFAGGLFNIGVEYKSEDSGFGYLLNLGYSPFGGDGWEHSLGGWFVSPELRYYIPQNDKWFVGAQLLAGGYNVRVGERNGHQGSVIGGGVTGGYRITLTECFDMDFNLGVGYGSYKYDSYYHEDGVNRYDKQGIKRGAILPQAGVNLIWKIR